jgi:hypothetical protein
MTLNHLQHAINWWQKEGNINIPLLEKVLEAKKKLVPKNTFKKQLNIQIK